MRTIAGGYQFCGVGHSAVWMPGVFYSSLSTSTKYQLSQETIISTLQVFPFNEQSGNTAIDYSGNNNFAYLGNNLNGDPGEPTRDVVNKDYIFASA